MLNAVAISICRASVENVWPLQGNTFGQMFRLAAGPPLKADIQHDGFESSIIKVSSG